MRHGRLDQLTEDHSLLNDYIKMKKLTPEEIENFPHKNVITRYLGMKEIQVDVLREKVSPGDLYLLCTDGIHGYLTDKESAEILSSQEDLQTISEQLISRVNQNERADNSTAVLVRCG